MRLLIVRPDWSQPCYTDYIFRTERVVTETGVEHRTPENWFCRMLYRYTAAGDGTDAAVIRNFLGSRDARRVVVPLWMDERTAADWPNRYHSARCSAGWDDGFTNINVAANGDSPTGAYHAPLLIGRVGRSQNAALTDELGDFVVELREEGQWAYRAAILPAAPATFPMTPNWLSTPTEATRDFLRYENLGQGREDGLTGDALPLWSQSALFQMFDETEIRSMLGFFAGRKGSAHAFTGPSWFRPGAQTDAAPHEFDGGARGRLRFSSDILRVDWDAPAIADTRVGMEQVLDDAEAELPYSTFLYQVWSDYDPSAVEYRTSGDVPLDWGGHTWTPARIEHSRPQSSLKPQDEGYTIKAWLPDFPPLQVISRGESDAAIYVEIYEAEYDGETVTAASVFFGRVRKPKVEGHRVEFRAAAFAGYLEHKVPRLSLSRTCNYCVFDGACKRLRPTEMTPAQFESTGTLHQWVGWDLHVELKTFAPWYGVTPPWSHSGAGEPAGGLGVLDDVYLRTDAWPGLGSLYIKTRADGWDGLDIWAGGWIEVNTGLQKQVRVIVQSHFATGEGDADVLFWVDRPFRLDLIDAETATWRVYPGCDGRYSVCRKLFANEQTFMGAPFAPAWIEQAPTPGYKIGGGK